MKAVRRGTRYVYVEGNYRRAMHTLWHELTGEKILPVERRADAEYYSVEIFKLRHSQTRAESVDVAYALPLYFERCRVKGLSERSIKQRKQQLDAFGASHVNDLTTAYIQKRLDALKCKGASRNRYLSAVSSFLEFCKRSGYVRVNHARDVERYREVKEDVNRIITPLVVEKIKSVSSDKLRYVIDLAYQTGLRRGEIHYLWTRGWVDVDLVERWVTFPANAVKNRRAKTIPLRAEAVTACNQLKLRGYPAYNSPDAITRAFDRACKRAGVDYRFHDFRHTFVTRAMETLPPNVVAVLVGHTTPAVTTSVYTHFGAEFLKKALDSI